jgi:hypothetical protein
MRLWRWTWNIGAVIVLAACAWGQTGKYIAISPDEATKAKATYERMKQAEDDWKSLEKQIGDKYLPKSTGVSIVNKGGVVIVVPENPWQGGFEFSDDFKLLLPAPLPTVTDDTDETRIPWIKASSDSAARWFSNTQSGDDFTECGEECRSGGMDFSVYDQEHGTSFGNADEPRRTPWKPKDSQAAKQ